MKDNQNPSLHIKPNLSVEIETWLEAGNKITVIQTKYINQSPTQKNNFQEKPEIHIEKNAAKLPKDQKEQKRLRKIEDQPTQTQIKKFGQWLNTKKGRAKALVVVLGCAHSYVSQIKSATRTCSKERFEEIKNAMKVIEVKEKSDL